jgi:chromate transporter
VVVLIGARHFDLLRRSPTARGFLDGAGPAAIGAILGSAVALARTLSQPWQFVVLAAAAGLLLTLRRGTVLTLLAAAVAGIALVSAGLAPTWLAASRAPAAAGSAQSTAAATYFVSTTNTSVFAR